MQVGGVFPADTPARLAGALGRLLEVDHPALNGLVEILFLDADDFRYLCRVLLQLREGVAHVLHHNRHQLVDERLAQVEVLIAEADRAADDAAEHRVTLLVAGPRSIGDGERGHAEVIGNDAKADVDQVVEAGRRMSCP